MVEVREREREIHYLLFGYFKILIKEPGNLWLGLALLFWRKFASNRICWLIDPWALFDREPDPDHCNFEIIQHFWPQNQDLKVHKNENFFGFDFEICTFS